ncbi:MAG: Arc family DNA-binding protein [Chloroflexi bacterium]|nr:Arc family DNA-binding protein [Chloroflexota bacterium]
MTLTVKGVPDDLLERLRERAKRNHRSLQGELMAILEGASEPGELTVEEAEQRLRRLNFSTPDESTRWIRELRDSR